MCTCTVFQRVSTIKIQLCLSRWTLSSHRKVICSSHDIAGIKVICSSHDIAGIKVICSSHDIAGIKVIWCKTTNTHSLYIFENIQQINRKKERGHSILVFKKHFSLVVHENGLLYISSANGISIRIESFSLYNIYKFQKVAHSNTLPYISPVLHAGIRMIFLK